VEPTTTFHPSAGLAALCCWQVPCEPALIQLAELPDPNRVSLHPCQHFDGYVHRCTTSYHAPTCRHTLQHITAQRHCRIPCCCPSKVPPTAVPRLHAEQAGQSPGHPLCAVCFTTPGLHAGRRGKAPPCQRQPWMPARKTQRLHSCKQTSSSLSAGLLIHLRVCARRLPAVTHICCPHLLASSSTCSGMSAVVHTPTSHSSRLTDRSAPSTLHISCNSVRPVCLLLQSCCSAQPQGVSSLVLLLRASAAHHPHVRLAWTLHRPPTTPCSGEPLLP